MSYKQITSFILSGFVNADWANNVNDGRSTPRYCFNIGSGFYSLYITSNSLLLFAVVKRKSWCKTWRRYITKSKLLTSLPKLLIKSNVKNWVIHFTLVDCLFAPRGSVKKLVSWCLLRRTLLLGGESYCHIKIFKLKNN